MSALWTLWRTLWRASCPSSAHAGCVRGQGKDAGSEWCNKRRLCLQAERDEEEISEVEMILETYFMHIDNTFNKLQTLCEYIDDTEVCIVFCLASSFTPAL